jgi:hypothetical protein
MLSFEGQQFQGAEAIVEKLVVGHDALSVWMREGLTTPQGLPFSTVQHKITTQDAQPSSSSVASMIVSVTGLLVVDGGEQPLQFSQVFQLIPDGASYYVSVPLLCGATRRADAPHSFNDIFRLNYG